MTTFWVTLQEQNMLGEVILGELLPRHYYEGLYKTLTNSLNST